MHNGCGRSVADKSEVANFFDTFSANAVWVGNWVHFGAVAIDVLNNVILNAAYAQWSIAIAGVNPNTKQKYN